VFLRLSIISLLLDQLVYEKNNFVDCVVLLLPAEATAVASEQYLDLLYLNAKCMHAIGSNHITCDSQIRPSHQPVTNHFNNASDF